MLGTKPSGVVHGDAVLGQPGKFEIRSCGISGQPLLCTAPWGHIDYVRDDDVGNDDGDDDGEAGEDYSG